MVNAGTVIVFAVGEVVLMLRAAGTIMVIRRREMATAVNTTGTKYL